MLCQTYTRRSLADEAAELGECLAPEKRSRLLAAMASAVDGLRRLRARKRLRDWHQAHPLESKRHANAWYHRNRAAVIARNHLPDRFQRKADYSRRYQQHPARRERRKELYRATEKWKLRQRERAKSPEGRAYARAYQQKRRRENPHIHFLNWLRGSINRAFRNQGRTRSHRTVRLLGCHPKELMSHLQAQFHPEMTWDRPRSWDVDHLVPVSKFNLADPEEVMWAFNYRNLRPLERTANIQKSDTIPDPLPNWLPPHIAERIKARQ